MTIGVALGTPTEGNAVDGVVELAREVAGAGFGSVWLGQRFDYDAITLAGVIGREIPELQVGTSAVPIFARHPLLVVSQAQTVQAATHGRFQLGLALGSKLTEDAFGIPFKRPVALLREFITSARELIATGNSDHHGELLTVATPFPSSVPGAGTDLPILVAAMGPKALQASGELADGILPFLAGPKTLEKHIVPTVNTAAEAAGRPPVRTIAFVAAVVTEDVDGGREAARAAMGLYNTIPSYRRVIELEGASEPAELALIGSAQHVRDGIQRYFDAGATEVVLTQTNLLGDEMQTETWNVVGQLNSGSAH